jgi:hypothetical protein
MRADVSCLAVSLAADSLQNLRPVSTQRLTVLLAALLVAEAAAVWRFWATPESPL